MVTSQGYFVVDPARAVPLPPVVVGARAVLEGSAADLLRVPDGALERPWPWRGRDADVRYGFYRLYETLEEAEVELAVALDGVGVRQPVGGRILGQANAARWDLHGLLRPLTEEELDRDPGGGEWTVRQTLGHLLWVQEMWSYRAAYSVERVRRGGTLPVTAPEGAVPPLPSQEEQARGTPAELRRRLDELLDLGIGLVGGVDAPAELDGAARWGWDGRVWEVDVRFRLHRWASHLREHTIQVEKTLVLLGRAPTEVERLVRLLLGAYGRLEGRTFGVAASALKRAPAGGASPAAVIARAMETVRRHAEEIAAAALA